MRVDPKRIARGMYWTQALSLVEGCTACAPECAHCWSAQASNMRQYNPNAKTQARYAGLLDAQGKFNGQVRFMAGDLDKPLRTRKPTVWAVWNDLFHEGVTFESIDKVFAVMALCLRHTFLVLTKRPERMVKYLNRTAKSIGYLENYANSIGYTLRFNGIGLVPFPLPNIGLSTTCGHPDSLRRVQELLKCPAAVRFLSCEPLLGELDLTWIGTSNHYDYTRWNALTGEAHAVADGTDIPWDTIHPVGSGPINWLVLGCESGPRRRPCKLEWVESLIHQADAADVPVFVKQLDINGKVTANMADFPEWARRREFPGSNKSRKR